MCNGLTNEVNFISQTFSLMLRGRKQERKIHHWMLPFATLNKYSFSLIFTWVYVLKQMNDNSELSRFNFILFHFSPIQSLFTIFSEDNSHFIPYDLFFVLPRGIGPKVKQARRDTECLQYGWKWKYIKSRWGKAKCTPIDRRPNGSCASAWAVWASPHRQTSVWRRPCEGHVKVE